MAPPTTSRALDVSPELSLILFSARELQSAQSGPAPALSRGFPGHTAIAEEGLSPLRTGSVLDTGRLTVMTYAYDLTDFLD